MEEIAMYLFIGGLPVWFVWAIAFGVPRGQRAALTVLVGPVAIAAWTGIWEFLLGVPADRGVYERGFISIVVVGLLASLAVPSLLCGAWTRPIRYRAWLLGPPAIVVIYLIQRRVYWFAPGAAVVAWLDWGLAALTVVHATSGPRPRWILVHLGLAGALPWLIQRW